MCQRGRGDQHHILSLLPKPAFRPMLLCARERGEGPHRSSSSSHVRRVAASKSIRPGEEMRRERERRSSISTPAGAKKQFFSSLSLDDAGRLKIHPSARGKNLALRVYEKSSVCTLHHDGDGARSPVSRVAASFLYYDIKLVCVLCV